MICKNCGKSIEDDSISFCPYCRGYLKDVSNNDFSSFDLNETSNTDPTPNINNDLNNFNNLNNINDINQPVMDVQPENKPKKAKKIIPFIVVVLLWAAAMYFLFLADGSFYFFKDNFVKASSNDIGEIDPTIANYKAESKSGQTAKKAKLGVTSIVYDNQYKKQTVLKSVDDVYKMIVTDSLKQKNNCSAEVVVIENEIITNYGIRAVNLCEMETDFAEELRDVIKYIYEEYPSARNYMTNITLANVDSDATFMAAFMPIFTFATSNTSSGYPVGIKTQIILNAKFFLNPSKIDSSVSYGTKSGYFPPNATRSSTVAHEFGHYLSYIALLNHYNNGSLTFVKNSNSKLMPIYNDFNEGNFSYDIINEAYLKYKQSADSNMSFDEFRASISKYAVAKDGEGNYIYDETIAEAFHDCYLNGDNAQLASKLIIGVLLSYL